MIITGQGSLPASCPAKCRTSGPGLPLGDLPGADSVRPEAILIRAGEPVPVVRDLIGSRADIAALVLGAAPSGDPGPLVAAFSGSDAGKLPCPVMIIPGSLSDDRLEDLS